MSPGGVAAAKVVGPNLALIMLTVVQLASAVILFDVLGLAPALGADPLNALDEARACPIDQVAGQILDSSGPTGGVRLWRNGRLIPISQNACVLYGDKLEVSRGSTVNVVTAQDTLAFSGSGKTARWTPVSPTGPSSPGVIGVLQGAFGQLFAPNRAPPVPGFARGSDTCSNRDDPGPPMAPLARFPIVPQMLGNDLSEIFAVWSGGSPNVTVTLLRQDGVVIASAHSCWSHFSELLLSNGALQPGERLTLRIGDAHGDTLSYPVEIVSRDALPSPAERMDDWIRGAWQLTSAGDGYRLDAIARVAAGSKTDYPARRIIQAVISNEPF